MSLQKRLSSHEIASHQNANDMTSDLASLNFETSLSSEELAYVPLRARHHCFSVTSCAYAVYLVSAFNELRQVLSEMKNPVNRKTIKFFKQVVPRDPIKVGIIGCGRLGKQIVSCLLEYSDVRIEEITISTRRPNLLNSFRKAGITCLFNNEQVVSMCNLVFLCCLPSHVSAVMESIAGHISENCIICSFVTGITLPRLKQLTRHNGVIKTEFTWSMNNAHKAWSLGENVVSSLKSEAIAEHIHPLSLSHREGSIVWLSPKAVECAIYGALNMCPLLGVTTEEAINLMNIVFLGTTDTEKCLHWKDILDEESLAFVGSGNLPVFDLFHIGTQDTPLTDALKDDEMKTLVVAKYMNIFKQFKKV